MLLGELNSFSLISRKLLDHAPLLCLQEPTRDSGFVEYVTAMAWDRAFHTDWRHTVARRPVGSRWHPCAARMRRITWSRNETGRWTTSGEASCWPTLEVPTPGVDRRPRNRERSELARWNRRWLGRACVRWYSTVCGSGSRKVRATWTMSRPRDVREPYRNSNSDLSGVRRATRVTDRRRSRRSAGRRSTRTATPASSARMTWRMSTWLSPTPGSGRMTNDPGSEWARDRTDSSTRGSGTIINDTDTVLLSSGTGRGRRGSTRITFWPARAGSQSCSYCARINCAIGLKMQLPQLNVPHRSPFRSPTSPCPGMLNVVIYIEGGDIHRRGDIHAGGNINRRGYFAFGMHYPISNRYILLFDLIRVL